MIWKSSRPWSRLTTTSPTALYLNVFTSNKVYRPRITFAPGMILQLPIITFYFRTRRFIPVHVGPIKFRHDDFFLCSLSALLLLLGIVLRLHLNHYLIRFVTLLCWYLKKVYNTFEETVLASDRLVYFALFKINFWNTLTVFTFTFAFISLLDELKLYDQSNR